MNRTGKTSMGVLLTLTVPPLLLAGVGLYILFARYLQGPSSAEKRNDPSHVKRSTIGSRSSGNRQDQRHSRSHTVQNAQEAKKGIRQDLSRLFPGRKFRISMLQYAGLCVEKDSNVPTRKWMENARKRLRALRTHLKKKNYFITPNPDNDPIKIVVLKDRESYRQYLSSEQFPRFQNSHYEPGRRQVVMYYDSGVPYRRLLHEATHIYTGGRNPDMDRFPFWSLEGLSMIMENGGLSEDGTFQVQPLNRTRLREWKKFRNSGYMMSLRNLVQLTHMDFTGLIRKTRSSKRRKEKGAAIYAQAWGLTYYLYTQKGSSRLSAFMDASRNNSTRLSGFFEKHFGKIKQLEKKYLQFVDGKAKKILSKNK